MEFEIRRYSQEDNDKWDAFCQSESSVFGTFLHSRRFLSYHSPRKFIDHSLIIYRKKNIIAIFPACEIVSNDKRVLSSHKGSTFGGLVVYCKYAKTLYLIEIMDCIKKYCLINGFTELEIKLTPNIYCVTDNYIIQYILFQNGFKQYVELSTYSLLKDYEDGILKHFEQGKRTNVNNCVKAGLLMKEINKENEIDNFYKILNENLKKHDTVPVHSIKEIVDFRFSRLSDVVKIFGIYKSDILIAGVMLFRFIEVNFLHTQYLCADEKYDRLSPMSFLYYSLIKYAIENGYAGITWGTSTEARGAILNEGLIRSKEAFGSRHYLNISFVGEIVDENISQK